jgi:protein SCO1/2
LETAAAATVAAVRRAPLLLLAALLLAGCGGSHAAADKPTYPPQPPSRFRGTPIPPKPAPAIALHDASGRAVSLASRRGGWTLVTFLYTHCPDVCPLIAANLNQALRLVGAPKRDVAVLAVSVDPKGDTPAAVRTYLRQKHLVPQFHFLIGSRAELRRVWVRYHVAAVARSADVVDHVAYTVLVDPRGRERVFYDPQVKAADVVHDLRVLHAA